MFLSLFRHRSAWQRRCARSWSPSYRPRLTKAGRAAMRRARPARSTRSCRTLSMFSISEAEQHGVIVFPHPEKPAKRHNGVGHLAADLVDHDALHTADLIVIGSVDGRAVDLVAADQGDGFPSVINCGWHFRSP